MASDDREEKRKRLLARREADGSATGAGFDAPTRRERHAEQGAFRIVIDNPFLVGKRMGEAQAGTDIVEAISALSFATETDVWSCEFGENVAAFWREVRALGPTLVKVVKA